jgi:hypothetical protein
MRRILALSGGLLVVLVFVVGQFVLPGIAASMLRDRLAKSGHVLSVDVSAFPAIELLWHDADKVTVRMANYRSSTGHLTSLLDQAHGVGTVHASVGTLNTGLLTVTNATLTKQGNHLSAGGDISEDNLRAAVPLLSSVSFVSSRGGALTLSGTTALLGIPVSAVVSPQDGHIVVTAEGVFDISIFSDPNVRVLGVGGSATSDGLALSATGEYQ